MIARLVAVACHGDRAVLERLGGSFGVTARAVGAEIRALAIGPRKKLRARVVAVARAPVPAGIRGVHASWIEAGLVGLPERARVAIARGGEDPVDVWLARWALAEIPPMPAIDAGLVVARSLDDAVRMSGPRLAGWLAEIGADQLAHALARAGVAPLTAVASRVVGERLVIAARRIALAPRAGALGPARAAVKRCRGALPIGGHAARQVNTRADDALLVRIGARAIAPRVDVLARRQLAVRLPRPLGLVVHGELRAYATMPISACPTWDALGAGG